MYNANSLFRLKGKWIWLPNLGIASCLIHFYRYPALQNSLFLRSFFGVKETTIKSLLDDLRVCRLNSRLWIVVRWGLTGRSWIVSKCCFFNSGFPTKLITKKCWVGDRFFFIFYYFLLDCFSSGRFTFRELAGRCQIGSWYTIADVWRTGFFSSLSLLLSFSQPSSLFYSLSFLFLLHSLYLTLSLSLFIFFFANVDKLKWQIGCHFRRPNEENRRKPNTQKSLFKTLKTWKSQAA